MSMFGSDADAKAESLRQFTQLIRAVHGDTHDETAAVVEMRCLYRGTDKRKRKTVHKWATAHMIGGLHDELCDLNDAGYCIYYSANPRKEPGGTTAEDVEIATAQFIDIDNGCTTEQLLKAVDAAGLPAPSLVVETGGGCQAVWPLTRPTPVAEWCSRQVGINTVVEGADSTIKDAPRIMRAPGFRNRKRERGPDFPMACLVVEHDTRHEPESFPEGQTYAPPKAKLGAESGEPEPLNIAVPKGMLPKFARDFLERGQLLQPKGKEQPSRRETAFRVCIEMQAAGYTQDDAEIRVCAQLYALGLEESDVADFRERQIPNAYSKDRTPTIDADRMPKAIARPLPAEPETVITDAGNGKHRVLVRRGVRSHIDTLDLAKQSARERYLKAAGAALGEGTDLEFLHTRLKAVATGDEQAAEPDGPSRQMGFKQEDFISVEHMVRPERFAVAVGDDFTAGTTVARFREGSEGAEGLWLTFISKADGSREAIELPVRITVGETTFHTFPRIPAPAVEPKLGWSEPSQWQWLDDGKATIHPAKLFDGLVNAFEKFLEIEPATRQGMLETLALWTVATYMAEQFEVVAYLAITGPRGSGKSRCMHCLNQVAFRAHLVANPTAASLYRHLHVHGGTVIVDEAENLEQSDPGSGLAQTLLTSNTRGMSVPRCDGDDNTPKNFIVYGPKVFISIAEPNDTLLDRAVHFRMFRARPGSPKSVLHPKSAKHRRLWQSLRDGLNTMVLAYAKDFLDLPDADLVVPDGMFPRTMETWSGLLQIAAVFDRLGVDGLLVRMQAFAKTHGEGSEQETVPSEHESILKAFVSLRTAGKPTTSAAILSRAYVEGLDAQVRMTDKATGKVLSGYGLARGTGRKRYEWGATDEQLARVQAAYGIQLFDQPAAPEKTTGTTPEKTLTTLTTLTTSGFPEGNTTSSGEGIAHGERSTSSTSEDHPGVCAKWNAHIPDTPTGTLTQKPPENKAETADVSDVSDVSVIPDGAPNISGKVVV